MCVRKLVVLCTIFLFMSGTMAEAEDNNQFFFPIAGVLEGFAKEHNLLIEKYYHDFPAWSLCFTHPAGGQSKIDVTRESDGSLSVQGSWWEDEYETFTRHIYWGEKYIIKKDAKKLTDRLHSVFSLLLHLKHGTWTKSYPDYKDIWGRYTKSEFEAMTPRWPNPKL